MNSQSPLIRVLIVEDHVFVRESLRQYLSAQPDIDVVADTEFGEEAIRIVEEQAPNVVLLDLVLERSQLSGLDVLQRIRELSPITRVVVLSAYSSDELAFPALQHGAIGYILKNSSAHEVIDAVRDASTGYYHLDPMLATKIVGHLLAQSSRTEPPELGQLTPREREVLTFMLKNKSNSEIGKELAISVATVKTHVSNILHKLELRDRRDLELWWKQQTDAE